MSYIVLDTDVTSLSFKQLLPAALFARLVGRPTCITFVTFGELTQWGVMGRWGSRRRAALAQQLAHLPILPGDREVAETWGRMSAAAKMRGRPRPQNDTWIAACCLAYGLPLATRNVKDFEDFAKHEGLIIISA
ncbi:MAG TPA: type II toxin-antitoxin system VapC family toxin [Actinophytocola sp.]|uniref:type II toxin-antitoxin system VapC family toxin n=1 Tax=Actinophytocola sp. TaxID=1872138 RepID=UPI002DDCBE5E|nr:type II toxin-antitoxin system VapC family toxin [Actinophytocola sp.]HEV2781397.1 type II toxin-antitoxin system VapC family toxin [Actinophytocola sp.]